MSPSKVRELEERRQASRGSVDPDAEVIIPPSVPPKPEPPAASGVPSTSEVDVDSPAVDNEPHQTHDSRETHEERPVRTSNPATWASTLDDPAVIAGRMQARSNYIEDTAFARYRAAVYWLSRNPEAIAAGVPENVSAGVNAFLEREAARLEKRFNGGNPFPATPEQEKKARSKRSTRR